MIDQSIIELCRAGDQRAIRQVFTYFAPRMKGLCLRYSKSDAEAEDILQDAFIKVFSKILSYNFEGSFEGWVKRIVVNTAINSYRKNMVVNDIESYDESVDNVPAACATASQLSADDLLNIINKLPDGYKVVFNMYAIDGYSHKEIAETLNISEGTSRSQLTKAKKYIQNILLQLNYTENERR